MQTAIVEGFVVQGHKVSFYVGEQPGVIVNSADGIFLGATDTHGEWTAHNGQEDNVPTVERIGRAAIAMAFGI